MARDILNATMQLDRIHCFDEGDGWGNAEPYLWTVFFKIDGTTCHVTDDLRLAGTATVVSTPGSHGNLGTTDVGAGDNVNIPEAIGFFQTTLKPIPTPAALAGLVQDIPAIVGVVCVLMEEDNVSDDGAEAGHAALNAGVQTALDQIIATRSFSNQNITDAEINAFVGDIEGKVKDAVKNQQNVFENIWSWLNADDTIGSKVFFFTQDQLAGGNTVNFSERFKNEGDWEIFGHAITTVACPAEAVANLGKILSGQKTAYDAEGMRRFRDTEFRTMRGLQEWWSKAESLAPQIALAALGDRAMQASAAALLRGAGDLLKQRDKAIPEALLAHAETVFRGLLKLRSGEARKVATQALQVLPALKAKTPNQAFKLLSQATPLRSLKAPELRQLGIVRLRKPTVAIPTVSIPAVAIPLEPNP